MATHRDQRRLVHLTCEYRAGDAWHPITICNISANGLMAKCAAPPAKGVPVEVHHNGFVISGEVAWSLGERFGLRCQPPTDLRALQDFAREGRVGRRSTARVGVRVAGEFILGDEAYTVLLTEISQQGARVYMPVPPAAATRGLLCWGRNERRCTVLWAGPDSVGVTFDELLTDPEVIGARTSNRRAGSVLGGPVWSAPQLPPHLHTGVPAERRRSRRVSLTLDCEVRQGDTPWLAVTLEDVARSGFRLAWFAGCQVSQPLTLRLPEGTMLQAAIDRHDDYLIACRFADELDSTLLDRIAANRPPPAPA
jgi:hypothetical protein